MIYAAVNKDVDAVLERSFHSSHVWVMFYGHVEFDMIHMHHGAS